MDAFEAARQNAAELNLKVTQEGAEALNPHALVEAALVELDLDLFFLDPGDPALKGSKALYDDQAGHILCEQTDNVIDRALLVGHEIGHARLHAGSASCHSADIDPTRSTEVASVGLDRVEDYGARERRELHANVFAREFFLPRAFVKYLFLSKKWNALDFTEATGLPLNLVRQQLFDALLLPEYSAEQPNPALEPFVSDPDEKQELAARHQGSAFQLQAGPGTGKTRTLIKRVNWLLEGGADPASLLVLTFSNRAAGELSERLIKDRPEEAAKIWIGTFHAFGLDLVRRHYDLLGVSDDPTLFDRSDAISVLEEILPTLPLVHYRDLWDPARVLRDIVTAISRAKDEMVGPEAYRAMAAEMRASCDPKDEDQIKLAEKSLEIADVYDLYELALHQHGGVDFGDLIKRPAELLENNQAIRATAQLRHRHVLVDEYQDVNRASARLLKAVAGDGSRLWVVGDARQSIYRFRGASSRNMVAFAEDYPGATIDRLEKNYRSADEVVQSFSTIAPQMGASQGMLPLDVTSVKGVSGVLPQVHAFPTLHAEALGVAASVKELEEEGVLFRDQAILCRSNGRLDELAKFLEAEGIPVLHLGSLFEREDIRDLLSLLKLLVDPYADSLVRVATMSRYEILLQDAHDIMSYIREQSDGGLAVLASAISAPNISEKSRKAISLLCSHLEGHNAASSPWNVLADLLLDKTDFLREIGSVDTVSGKLRAVAIWQFLNFVRDQRGIGTGTPINRLLDRIRQMVLLSEERDLRQVPLAALQLDAVRMMTVHASKGLEFEAVHIPGLTTSSFPCNYRGVRCPPPNGMIEGDAGLGVKAAAKKAHEDEEECLFFVALSRAIKHLRLYRSKTQRNGKTNRSPSKYLDWLPTNRIKYVEPAPGSNQIESLHQYAPVVVSNPAHFVVSQVQLQSYEKCPRRYFYTHLLGLGGARKSTAFSKTHDCIYRLIDWVAEQRLSKNPSIDATEKAFETIWSDHGPIEHAYADSYRTLASKLIASIIRSGEAMSFRSVEPITVDIQGTHFRLYPDDVADLADGSTAIRRVRTGYKRSDEYRRLEYALYAIAAQQEFGVSGVVEAVHLTDNSSERVNIKPQTLSNNKEKARLLLESIGQGQFPPDPDPALCPRCPHFFSCASTPDGSLTLS